MPPRTAIRTVVAGAAAVALLATTAAPASAAPVSASAPGGELRIFSLEPVSLIPSDATDRTSMLVLRQLHSGLVDYALDGTPVLDLAESIESVDNQQWSIEISPGYAFHDGDPVDAEAFIQGWDRASQGPNAHLFARIASVEQVDDFGLLVTLDEPFAGFPALLGHTAFFPVAPGCLEMGDFCNENPIGNGPYQIVGSWEHDVGITLQRFDGYPDPGQALPDVLSYQIYPDLDAGCQAVRFGQLDVMFPIPSQCRPGDTLPPNDGYFAEDSNAVNYLGLPSYLPELADPRVRRALSLAIDWEQVVGAAFDGRLALAGGLAGPHVTGARPAACVDCRYDPVEAQALLAEAGGWSGGELALWAPAGSGHESWLTLVGDQLQANLGIDYRLEVGLALPDYLALAEAGGFTGAFWQGWDPDYPVLDAYLTPQFRTGAPANYSGYANPDVDDLLAAGDAEPDPAGTIALYQEAEDVILADLPVIPMWFDQWEAVYADTVDQFVWNLFTGPEYGLTTLHQN
ncbi:MAG: ABC transporter substrate-binding protein [Micromonosporaceae bacterium]|nr:ABC transporter substrate-binding protein [Micromonosporaceae bacterium]